LKTTLFRLLCLALLSWLIGGTALVAAPAHEVNPAALSAYSRGEELLGKGLVPAAIESFTRAVMLAPNQYGMRSRLDWLLLDEVRTAEAQKHFSILVSRFPEEKDSWVGLIVTRLRLADPSAALSACDQALARFPMEPLLLKLKAEALMSRPETIPQAVSVYDQLAQLEPQNPQWQERRQAASAEAARLSYEEALALLRTEQHQAALSAMAAAVDSAPRSTGYRTHYGWLLLQAERYSEAATAFATVLEIDPYKPDAYLGLAIARLNNGDGPGAAEAAQQGIARFGAEPELLEVLGDAYRSRTETLPQANRSTASCLRFSPRTTGWRSNWLRRFGPRGEESRPRKSQRKSSAWTRETRPDI
jgi:tetratricopeptide (TPR) repeat protein